MKNKEPSNDQVQLQEGASSEQVDRHEGTLHGFALAPDQACVDREEFQSPRSSSSRIGADNSGTTGKTFREPSC